MNRAICCLSLLSALCAPLANAGEVEAPVAIVGTVRDPFGQAVEGAKAWLVFGDGDNLDPPLQTSSNSEGRIAFPEADEERLKTGRSVTVIARDDAQRLGWRRLSTASLGRDFEVRLRVGSDTTGQVVNADGRPVAGAKLTCETFFVPHTTSPESSADLFPELAANYAATTDAEGKFALSLTPTGVHVRCRLSAPGFADSKVVLQAGEPARIRVSEPGSITGRFIFPDGAKRSAFEYRLEIASQAEPSEKPDAVHVVQSQVAVVDAEGGFRFDGLLPARYVISPVENQNAPFFAEATEVLEIKAGQHLSDVAIPLKQAQHVRGRVIDGATGDGVESVELSVRVWGSRDDREASSDSQGRFSFWALPGKVHVAVREVPNRFVPPAIARAEFREAPEGEWPTIELTRAAVVEGLVVDEAGAPVPFAQVDVTLDRQNLASPSLRQGTDRTPPKTDRSGRFTIGRLDPAQSLKLRARTSVAVTAGATSIKLSELAGQVTLIVSPKNACRISGRILDEEGNPLAQANVSVMVRRRQDLQGGMFSFPATAADVPSIGPDGRFESEALWAGDSYFLRIEADGFTNSTTDLLSTEAGNVYDFGTVVMHRLRMFRGQVVGDLGRPVPNADLRVQFRSPQRTFGFDSKTDASGGFVWQVDRGAVVSVWARAGSAVSNGAEVTIAALARDPITLTISDAFAFRFTGKVIDRRGEPVQDATVHVVWIEDPQRSGGQPISVVQRGAVKKSQFHVSESKVAADGSFTTQPLWPDLHYNVAVLAEGCQAWESSTLLAQPGERRLGEIVLTRSRQSVAGRVVDAKGRPIASATVINSGDADRPLTTQTAADGAFQLDGLPDGPVYLLVRKAGYWPAGSRRHAGDQGFDITLLDNKTVRASTNRPLADEPSDEERQFVREGLEQLWSLRDGFETQVGQRGRRAAGKQQLIECMAELDLGQALRWSAAEGGNYDDEARLAAAKRIVLEDLDGALLLAEVADERADYALRGMASRLLAAGANDAALRVLRAELAPRQARGRLELRAFSSATKKAEIGRQAIRCGADDWARQLIVEAADEVEKHLDDQQSIQAQIAVAEALALIDPPRAMRLWRSMPMEWPGYDFGHHRRIAAALAGKNLSDARTILEAVESGTRDNGRRLVGQSVIGPSDQVRTAIAYELARDDVNAALALIDERPFTAMGAKAEALSWLALAAAKRDKPRAWRLIDHAFEICLDHPENGNVGFNGGRPFNAARIALKAQKIGYPDMPSVVDRVLAVRSTPQEVSSAVMRVESTLMVARLLALIEPPLARELLVSIERDAALIGTGQARMKHGDWLAAWALVDLTRARQLFADALGHQERQPTPELFDSDLIPMLQLLALPPADRAGYLEGGLAYTFVLPFTD